LGHSGRINFGQRMRLVAIRSRKFAVQCELNLCKINALIPSLWDVSLKKTDSVLPLERQKMGCASRWPTLKSKIGEMF